MNKLFSLLSVATIATAATAATAQTDGSTSNTKVKGFADFQYNWMSPENLASDGFRLNDAALYFSHALGGHSLTLDLPFGATAGNDFAFTTSKAQAYIDLELNETTHLWVGQFDTPYGLELNDSKDIFFVQPGLIYTNVLPTTHAGLLAAFAFSDLSLKVLVANPRNTGMQNGASLEGGAVLGYSAESSPVKGSVGALFSKEDDVTDVLYNVLVNVSVGEGKTLDFEGDFITSTGSDLAWAALGQYTHAVSEGLTAGVSGEYLSRVSNHSVLGVRAGLTKALNDALKLKADYAWTSTKLLEDSDAAVGHRVGLAAVYAF